MDHTADRPNGDDVRHVIQLCAEALEPLVDRDWSVPPADLEWTAEETLNHLVGVQLFYTTQLSTRAEGLPLFMFGPIMPSPRAEEMTRPALLVAGLRTAAAMLADAVAAAPPEARGFHRRGRADRSGFGAMGCDEMLVHTHDIVTALGGSFRPPDEVSAMVVRRLFPWVPEDSDPWQTLLWCNGRTALSDRPRLGSDWTWHCAPLREWDGTAPPGAMPAR